MPFDANRAYEHAKNLSFPRLVGSKGEKKAQNYIIDQFKRMNYDLEVQDFSFSEYPQGLFLKFFIILLVLLLFISFYFYSYSHIVSASISFITILIFISASNWNTLIEKLYNINQKLHSKNIIGTKRIGNPKKNIILMAHYDTKSQTLLFPIRLLFAILFFGSIFLLSFLILLSSFLGNLLLLPDSFIKTMFIPIFSSLPLIFNFVGNKSSGAIDNASGVGVLLELGRAFSIENLENTQVTILATSAEEMGMAGSIRYVQRYGRDFDIEKTFFLNIEGCGSLGKVIITASFLTSRILKKIASKVSKERGIKTSQSFFLLGAIMDHIPIAHRKFEAITISCGGFKKNVYTIHSKYDSVEKLDLVSISKVGDFVYWISKKIM